MFDVTLLGTGGMMPMPNRYLTSLLIRQNGNLILVDCGEGTQVSMRELGWGFKNIELICLTHYHADHVAGLPGLLLTIGNAGKETPLQIMGPPGLETVMKGLMVITQELSYPLELIECSPLDKTSMNLLGLEISSLPVKHNAVCLAYSFILPRQRKFCIEKASQLPIPKNVYAQLQRGELVVYDGATYDPEMVLGPERRGIKIAYCTDSRPTDALIHFVAGADLFVCEGMYGDDEFLDRAKKYMHMIFSESAQIAKKAGVTELWFTHFSPAFLNPYDYIEGARRIFSNAYVGETHVIKTIKYE